MNAATRKAAGSKRAAFAIEGAIEDTRRRIEGGSAKDLQKKAEAALLRPALVDVYRAARLDRGVKLTRKQASKEMAQRESEQKAREADAAREFGEKLARTASDDAREDVAASLRGLLVVRDMLQAIEDGATPYGLEPEVNAEIVGAFLVKHATKLERALFQLRAWDGERVGKNIEAIFADRLQRIE